MPSFGLTTPAAALLCAAAAFTALAAVVEARYTANIVFYNLLNETLYFGGCYSAQNDTLAVIPHSFAPQQVTRLYVRPLQCRCEGVLPERACVRVCVRAQTARFAEEVCVWLARTAFRGDDRFPIVAFWSSLVVFVSIFRPCFNNAAASPWRSCASANLAMWRPIPRRVFRTTHVCTTNEWRCGWSLLLRYLPKVH